MLLIDHVSITVIEIETVRPFYDAVMHALGVSKVFDRPDALGYGLRCDASENSQSYLSIYQSPDLRPDPRRHWCFKAGTRAQVFAFHAAGLANGGKDEGQPGIRLHYHADYFGAFLVDPSGNRIEAVCHRAE